MSVSVPSDELPSFPLIPIGEVGKTLCDLISTGEDWEHDIIRTKLSDICLLFVQDVRVTSAEQGRSWLDMGASLGNDRCQELLEDLKEMEHLEPLDAKELRQFAATSFSSACLENARLPNTPIARSSQWLTLGAQEDDLSGDKCEETLSNIAILESIVGGDAEKWQYDRVTNFCSVRAHTWYQLGKDERNTSIDVARRCFETGAEQGDLTCKDLIPIFLSLDAIGEYELWEVRHIAQIVESHYRISAGRVCFSLSWFFRQNTASRGIKWLQLGEILGCTYCESALAILPLFGERAKNEKLIFQNIVCHREQTSATLVSIASYQLSVCDALEWLDHDAGQKDPDRQDVVSLCREGLKSAVASIRYERDEAVYGVSLLKEPFKSGHLSSLSNLSSFTENIKQGNTVTHRFLSTTLLFGSLVKNQDSVLHRSFFRSSIREVQLLPIIASYLSPKDENKKKHVNEEETEDKEDVEEKERERETEMNITGLEDLCRYLLLDLSHIQKVNFSMQYRPTNYLTAFYPLLVSRLPPLLSLTFTHQGESDGILDLSWLSKLDTSKLERLELKGHNTPSLEWMSGLDLSNLKFLSLSHMDDTLLSHLSACDFSKLKELNLWLKMPSFSHLSKWKNFSPSKMTFTNCEIEDLSALSLLDLSQLDGPLNLTRNKLSDLEPLREVKDEIEILIFGNDEAVKKLPGSRGYGIGGLMQVFGNVTVRS